MAEITLLLVHDAAAPAASTVAAACAAAGIAVQARPIAAGTTELPMAVLSAVNSAPLVAVAGDSPACAVARAVAAARGTLVNGEAEEGAGDALLAGIAAQLARPALATWVTARQAGPAALVQWAQAHPGDPLAPAAALGVDSTGYAALVAAAAAQRGAAPSGAGEAPAPFPPANDSPPGVLQVRAALAVVLAVVASLLWLVPVRDDWHGVEYAIMIAHGLGIFPLAALLGSWVVYRRWPLPQGIVRRVPVALLSYLAITVLSLLLIPVSALVMFGGGGDSGGILGMWGQMAITIYSANPGAVIAFAAGFLVLQSLPQARLLRLGTPLAGGWLRPRRLLIGTAAAAALAIGGTVVMDAEARLGMDTVTAMERAGLFDPAAKRAKRGWLFPDAVPTLKDPAFAEALARFQASVGLEATGQPNLPTLAALKALPEKRDWVVDAGGNGDFTDIGAAVARAADGHRVLIRPGTYRTNTAILNNITVAGDGPADTIRLEAADPDQPVISLSCAQCQLSGVTLDARGRNNASLLALRLGGPTVRGNRLVGGSSALVVSAADGEAPTAGLVTDNDFVAGAAIWLRTGATTRLVGNRIVSNQPESVIVLDKGSNAEVADNQISNTGNVDQVLVFAASGSRARIAGNLFVAPSTNCLNIASGADVEIRNNRFERCGTRGGYDSIYVKRGGKARLADNNFVGGSRPAYFEARK